MKKPDLNLVNIVSTLILLTVWITIAAVYPTLPPKIPLQFDADGGVNRYGERYMILILPTLFSYIWYRLFQLDNWQMRPGVNKSGKFGRLTAHFILLILFFCLVYFISR